MKTFRIVIIICAITIIVVELIILVDYNNLLSIKNLSSGLVVLGMLLLITSLFVSAKPKKR